MTTAPTPLNHRPTLRRRRRLVSIVALVVVAAAGIALLVRYAVFQGSPDRESAPPAIVFHPCYLGGWLARCGTLSVAENPAAADGKRIALRVAVVKTASNDPKPDPLFWFAGWGSAGVTDDAASVISAFTRVLVDRDLVFIDQRGTGNSKVECRLPENQQPNAAYLAGVTAAARRCADRVGPNLRYYTSAVAVDDFDEVRQALGYDKINIYGVSYGVTTGQIYLLRHGSHVRTAVFDAGSLLDVHIFERQPPAMQRALELLFARCAADAACRTAYPSLRREYEQIVGRLARGPIPIPGTRLSLDDVSFAGELDTMTAYTPGKAAVPRLIHLVATGQLARAAAHLQQDTVQTAQLAYQLIIDCSEPWASWRAAEIDRLSRGTYVKALFRQSGARIRAACAGFPKADVPAEIGQRVHSTVPVLFLTGNEDGADPPANVANAQRELPNSRLVDFTAAGHGQLGLPCAQNLIADFVARGSARSLDVLCARTAAIQPFDTRK